MLNTSGTSQDITSSAHTAIPWLITEDGDAIISSDATVALMGDAKEKEANARLIAAAPQLLEAAKNALETMQTAGIRCAIGDDGEELKAAIAKAEGRA